MGHGCSIPAKAALLLLGWHQQARWCLAHVQRKVFPDYKIQYDCSPDTKARDFFSFYLLYEEGRGDEKGGKLGI